MFTKQKSLAPYLCLVCVPRHAYTSWSLARFAIPAIPVRYFLRFAFYGLRLPQRMRKQSRQTIVGFCKNVFLRNYRVKRDLRSFL